MTPAGTLTPTADNRTCLSNQAGLDMLELHRSALSAVFRRGEGRFTDEKLVVELFNVDESSLDWRSNLKVSSVFLRKSNGGALFDYDPAAKSGERLSSAGLIESLSFCYELPTRHAPSSGTPKATPPDTASFEGTDGPSSSSSRLLLGITLAAILAAVAVLLNIPRRRPVRRLAKASNWSERIWSTRRN